jgi:hypothetical protein
VLNVALKVVLQELLYAFPYQQLESGEFQMKTNHWAEYRKLLGYLKLYKFFI